MNLFEKIRSRDFAPVHSDRPWVVVVPTYAWRIPRIVEAWLKNTELVGDKRIYFVMTCGGSIGNAGKYLERLVSEKNMRYMGCAAVTMPENYIAMFSVPDRSEAMEIIARAEHVIDHAANTLRNGEAFPSPPITWIDRISSSIVNSFFYPVCVHAKRFYATDACVSCGQCAHVCPMENIHIKNGKPVWGKHCTHCMACICRCPKEAIEYGKHSRGLARYTCQKDI